jgi:predicted enzyme related to lactoylglutathione lyase
MVNPFIHVELNSDNRDSSKKFYGQLFKWEFSDSPSPVPEGIYTHIKVGEGTGGGIMKKYRVAQRCGFRMCWWIALMRRSSRHANWAPRFALRR